MAWDDFITECINYARKHPEQRFGQACMNALRLLKGPEAMRAVQTDIWEISDPQHPSVLRWFQEVGIRFKG